MLNWQCLSPEQGKMILPDRTPNISAGMKKLDILPDMAKRRDNMPNRLV
jgi:hypothetical protein